MSSFDEKGANHRNALAQVDDARQRALNAVSQIRQAPPLTQHPNLAPVKEDNRPTHSAILCTQAVVDYLLQLRPYRASSSTWDINFGVVELPKRIESSGTRIAGEPSKPDLWICRQPTLPLRNVSQLIEAANTTVQYSTNYPEKHRTKNTAAATSTPKPNQRQLPPNVQNDLMSGRISLAEAYERSPETTEAMSDGGEDEFVPASPDVDTSPRLGGNKGRVESFKLVFPSPTLLKIVELADEVAAELNLLAELKPPNKEDAEGF